MILPNVYCLGIAKRKSLELLMVFFDSLLTAFVPILESLYLGNQANVQL